MLSEVETSLAVSEIFRDFSTSPSASLEMTSLSWHEKNRNPIWPGTQFPAGVCRARKPEDWRARHRGRVRQDRQSNSRRAVRLRRGDRPDFAGRAVLSRVAEKRRPDRHRSGEQSVLVERGREILQQRPRDENRRRRSANSLVAIKSATAGHERKILSQPGISAESGSDFQLRRLAGVFQTVCRRRLEKCLSAAQLGRIFSRLRRDWPPGDDASGGSKVRHVLPLLLDRSAPCSRHALRTPPPVSLALSNGMERTARDHRESRTRCAEVKR